MQTDEYQKMADWEKTYWWHQGRLFLLESLIKTAFKEKQTGLEILEIGCGTGEITQFLEKYGRVTAVDIAPEALNYARERGVKNTILGDVNRIDLTHLTGLFDLVVAFDVLEHIQDDVETMKRACRLLKDGGYFIASVPAYKFLWSEHDEALHHRRRYHSFEIVQKLIDGGFKLVKKTHFVATAFPAIALYRILSNFFGRSAYPQTSYISLPRYLNRLMIEVLRVEAALLRQINLPWGSTLTVIAQKTEGNSFSKW